MRHAPRAAGWLLGSSSVVLIACSTSTPAAQAGLMVVADTDLAPSQYDEILVEVSQETSPGTFHSWLDDSKRVPSETKLPTTVFVEAGHSADQEVDVRITAYLEGAPVVLREAQLQAPTNRIATLYFLLAQACVGKVAATGAKGEPESLCAVAGDSCQPSTGRCGPSNTVSAASLPTFVPGQGLDAGPGTPAALLAGPPDEDGAAADDGSDMTGEGGATPDVDADTNTDATTGPEPVVEASTGPDGEGGVSTGDDATVDSASDAPVGCGAGLTPCDTGCVNEQSDIANCGGCGATFACGGGKTCTGGACSCLAGTHDCSGTCVGSGAVATCGGSCIACPTTANGTATCDRTQCGISCLSGYSACGTSCVNEQTDSANCGGCGLTCSVACATGHCDTAVIQAPSQQVGAFKFQTPLAFGVDATTAYWIRQDADGGWVEQVTLASGAITEFSGSGGEIANIYALSVSPGGVFFGGELSTGGTPSSYEEVASPGTGTPVFKSTPVDRIGAMTSDATNVYWIDTTANTLVKAPRTGAASTTLVSSLGQPGPAMAVDATNIYWSDNNGLRSIPIAGGSPTTLVFSASSVGFITVDASFIYWTSQGTSLVKAALSGPQTQTPLASGQTFTYVTRDGTTLYWSTGTQIEKLSMAGGTPVSVFTMGPLLAGASNFGSSSEVGVAQAARRDWRGGVMPRARKRRMPSSLRMGLATMKRSLRRR